MLRGTNDGNVWQKISWQEDGEPGEVGVQTVSRLS